MTIDAQWFRVGQQCNLQELRHVFASSHGYPIPEETQRVARAAFPCRNGYLHVIDTLGVLCLQARAQHEVLPAARVRQTTAEFRQQDAARAGIEGTHEQAIRRCGLRRSRYLGLAKTHLLNKHYLLKANGRNKSQWQKVACCLAYALGSKIK